MFSHGILSVKLERMVGTMTTRCYSAVVMQSHGGTKGVCGHVSTLTIKSVLEMRGVCKIVWENEPYLDGKAKSPLYRRM